MTTDYTWYRWTKGPRGTYRTREAAMRAWYALDARCTARGDGGAGTVFHGARLCACRTRELARTVDSSRERQGVDFVTEM